MTDKSITNKSRLIRTYIDSPMFNMCEDDVPYYSTTVRDFPNRHINAIDSRTTSEQNLHDKFHTRKRICGKFDNSNN